METITTEDIRELKENINCYRVTGEKRVTTLKDINSELKKRIIVLENRNNSRISLMQRMIDLRVILYGKLAEKNKEIARLQAIIKTEAEFHVIDQHKELQ